MALIVIDPIGQKLKIFNFELKSKLYLHFVVKFDGKSVGDSPEVQNLIVIETP